MSGSLDSLQELLNEYGMTVTDLGYIVRYLKNENISPQLAMRRIKSFDVLQQKMEDNSEKEVISGLRQELVHTEQTLKKELETTEARMQSILSEKTKVEDEKNKLESMTDLFDSERDELRSQLKLLQEMQIDEEPETDETITDGLTSLLDSLDYVISAKLEVKELLLPIKDALEQVSSSSRMTFDREAYTNSIDGIFAKLAPSQAPEEREITKPVEMFRDQTMRKPSDVARAQIQQPTKKVKKDKPKPKEKPKVDPRAVQVLDLFLDFLAEAETDKNFKDRISSICEMDEAYEHLGSIGLSQVYSFQSRGLEKKGELVKLLQSWKIEGVPR